MGEGNACWSDSGPLHAQEDGQLLFEAETPHFFRIVLSDHIQSGKLVIPKKFARRYGNNFSHLACLNVPSGDVWKMEVRRQNDDFCLQDGWSDFVKHYSIKHGYFLVFRYEGNSVFHVVICDRSTSEIKYPMVSKENCGNSKPGDEHLLSLSDNDFQSCKCKRRESPSSTQVRSPKKKKTKSPADDGDSLYEPSMETSSYSGSQEWTEISNDKGRQVRKDVHDKGQISDGDYCPKSVPCLSSLRFRIAEEVEVLSRTASFETTNPVFIVLMQPSYVQPPYSMNLPAAFFMTHVSNTSGIGCIKLLGSSGRVWTIQYHLGIYCAKPKVRVQSGWGAFVLDNKLQKGDACVFELTTAGSFKVIIYRANQCSSCGYSSNKLRNNAEPIKNPIEEKTEEARQSGRVDQRPLDALAEALVKRGRGRPRKQRPLNAPAEAQVKRGRGRPRKQRPLDAPVETQVRRGRGRPRKMRPGDEKIEVIGTIMNGEGEDLER
ncbi:hypothetical protein ACJRO7_030899 [Eucalyptus globulus]|uniref:TF-B3 domain-containing protein n=1 Tax=Eucalyptus globulus TaxID=34317 RepID=A0ABD3JJ97_EUCGL